MQVGTFFANKISLYPAEEIPVKEVKAEVKPVVRVAKARAKAVGVVLQAIEPIPERWQYGEE